ncbi:Prospero domain-containing protein [Aphelenchoides bicaudatus]|nr:Prospero domain-containing protein [Aphelenchoides bicaudatus]
MSGTLPASPILQQFQSNGSPSLSSFFASANSNPFSIGCLSDSPPINKNKRCRQRVDAGEPRNSYQGALMSQLRSCSDSKHADRRNENEEQDEDCESVEQQMQESDLLLGANDNQASDFELSDEDSSADQQDSNENPVDLCAVSSQPPSLSAELPSLLKSNDPTENRHTNNSAMSSSSSKRKRFQPQRQPIKLDHSGVDSNDEGNFKEKTPDEVKPKLESMEKTENTSKQNEEMNPLQKELSSRPNNASGALPSSLNANMNGNSYQSNMLANKMFVEMQRRMYASAMGQQQSQSQQNGQTDEDNNVVKNAVMKDFIRFVHLMNEKILTASNEFNLTETEKALSQQLKQQKDKQQQDWRGSQPFGNVGRPNLGAMNPLFNPLMSYTNPQQILAMAANQSPLHSIANSMAQQNSTSNSTAGANMSFANLVNNSASNNKLPGSGIFPTAVPNFSSFNGFVNHAAVNQLAKMEDGSPRKKRSKVTDSVRGPRSAVRDTGNSLPASSRSSPQPNGYFAPTMVPHPLYNNTSFRVERSSQSPGNSDEFSDYGTDGSFSQSSTLTPAHLRKAKLMFFYTRYPSSSVLKSYFPDINFNKSNTAQLVKWFSNFREFYYMCMEKFAKQAIAEGITNANEIVVTTESEIYKNLNVHYNRNNFITPPESLSNVIEETLKEFFRALQEGRDAEPSWKKSIYKIIQQLDEQIPERFKSPNFMVQLEGSSQQ